MPAQSQVVTFYTTPDETTDEELTGGTLELGSYQHVVLWWDGVEKRIYVNGLLRSSVPGTTRFTSGVVAIGADFDDGIVIAQFEGDLDDLRIYDRALDVAEITALVRLGN